MYGGKCDNENDTEQIVCKAPACPVPVPVDCVLTPSGLPYGACSATQCGTTGKQTRLKYRVERDALYGGKCLNKDEPESIVCSAPACPVPVNCVITPSKADWGECSVTECGQTGTRSRNKYTKDITEMNGGTCPSYWDDMEYTPCSTDACAQISTPPSVLTPSNKPVDNSKPSPSDEPEISPSTVDNNKNIYIIAGVAVAVILLLLILVVMMK
jgi:hypothetical protein